MKKQKNGGGLVQFLKFAVVGVVNTGVDWVVFYLLIHFLLGIDHSVAKAISFLVAMLNSYIWNSAWTFKSEYKNAAQSKSVIFTKFMVVSLIGWGVNVAIFNYSSGNLNLVVANKDLLPLVLSSAAAILWNFFANKFWTYKK